MNSHRFFYHADQEVEVAICCKQVADPPPYLVLEIGCVTIFPTEAQLIKIRDAITAALAAPQPEIATEVEVR